MYFFKKLINNMVLLHTHVHTQIPPTKITLGQNDFNGEFYQIFKKEIM